MIKLNFIPFKKQEIRITIYRKKLLADEATQNTYREFFTNELGIREGYEIAFQPIIGFEPYNLEPYQHTNLIAKYLYYKLISGLPEEAYLIKRKDDPYNKKIHFKIGSHPKGEKCVWVQPYFLKSKGIWGILFDFSFIVHVIAEDEKYRLDRDILIASGTLSEKGNSNVDFYLFKYNHLKKFIKDYLPTINQILNENLDGELLEMPSMQLAPKVYLFGNGSINNSPYIGLTKNIPLSIVQEELKYYFLYRRVDRDIAVSLLKGLKGESNPTTFPGIERLFRIPFSNDKIKGSAVESFSEEIIDNEIQTIKSIGKNVIPIIITNSKKDEEDEYLYFFLKHKFTNAGIPCQVVTKELINNDYSLKYSLSNIALQIFSKAGGKPWKMKPASKEYLIVGIGQSYNLEKTEEGNKIEKNITYSVLTDSSGLFKDIQVLGEGIESDENYYNQLVTNISNIITKANYKKVTIHVPFRMSKDKILAKVAKGIPNDIELNVLVINNKNDFFGFNYANNGLVPFESTYIKIAKDEYLVWFEGLQYNNPKITKRFGNPLLIKFWYSTHPDQFHKEEYKESLLQDCINLSGANWRGFKAKQLPVSVFYCQRIAEFISKFKQYGLAHIEISNLKPWFL